MKITQKRQIPSSGVIYGTKELLYKTESLIDTKDRLVVAKEELRWVWKD